MLLQQHLYVCHCSKRLLDILLQEPIEEDVEVESSIPEEEEVEVEVDEVVMQQQEVEKEVEEDRLIPRVRSLYKHHGQGMGFEKGEVK